MSVLSVTVRRALVVVVVAAISSRRLLLSCDQLKKAGRGKGYPKLGSDKFLQDKSRPCSCEDVSENSVKDMWGIIFRSLLRLFLSAAD